MVELINNKKSTIQDDYTDKSMGQKEVYANLDFIIIVAPTNVWQNPCSNVGLL